MIVFVSSFLLFLIAYNHAFDADVQLPCGIAQPAASGRHSNSVWVLTHATILFLISFETELLSVSGKRKKLQGLYLHVLSLYDARQRRSVNLLGHGVGCGKIGPGCNILSSVDRFLKIFLPGSPGAAGMLATRPLGFCVPLLAFLGMRSLAVPLLSLLLLVGDSVPVSF